MMPTSGIRKSSPCSTRIFQNLGSSFLLNPRRPSFFASKCTPAKMPQKYRMAGIAAAFATSR